MTKQRMLLSLASLLALPAAASAALIAYDGFDIPGSPTTVVGGAGSSSAGNASWTAANWSVIQTNLPYTATGLSFPGLSTVGGAATDNSASTLGARRPFDVSSTTASDLDWTRGLSSDDGKVLWFSVLVNMPAASGGDFRVKILNSGGSNNGGVGFAANVSNNGFFKAEIGTTNGSGTFTFADDTTYFIVGKYQGSATAGADTMSIWAFSSGLPADESSLGAPIDTVSGDYSYLSTTGNETRFAMIRGGGIGQGIADELRIGDSFLDVVPVPEPSAIAALFAGLVLAFAFLRRRK